MKDPFDFEARIYDKIWGNYDYDSDVRFLDELFSEHRCRRIIDIGCGTGNHAIRLGKMGYDVTGVDISPTMLRMARKKDKAKVVKFLQGDMRRLNKVVQKGLKFDAAICLGYTFFHLITDNDVSMFLKGLHSILKENGVFVFNARNAKKINEEKLEKLFLDHIISEEKFQMIVLSHNSRHPQNPNVMIWRPIFLIKEKNKVDLKIREHKLRWFHFSELEKMLIENGFDLTATYSGNSKETFLEEKHESMWFITKAIPKQ